MFELPEYITLARQMNETLRGKTVRNGRYDETDLYNQPGQYTRLMDKNAAGRPYPVCGGSIEKISYLGGTCYFCPHCQT